MASAYTLFFGTFIQLPRAPSNGKHVLSIHRGALWVSTSDGRIKGIDWSVQDEEGLRALMQRNGWIEHEVNGFSSDPSPSTEKVKIVRAREEHNEFFFPGFIGTSLPQVTNRNTTNRYKDTHIHAPQYPNSGLFGSSTLLDWLETYTFPLESSFGDVKQTNTAPAKVHTVYNQVVSRTLANGTTCASYFATIHVPATNLLASLCYTRGQRAFIGRVCMDNPAFCPNYYRDASAETSLSATKASISHIHSIDPDGDVVKPIITPRFAPACSRSSLEDLGKLAASYSPPLHVQTHISENKSEIALVKDVFPDCDSYADVYDRFNLLTPRTILAHGVHLTQSEMDLIRERRSKISHCPASNSALGSGLCPVRSLLDSGITVGLGTDVSGGYSPSILEQVRQACLVSRLLKHIPGEEKDGRENLSVEEGLFLATRGGAAVVDMEREIGGFEVGMRFDAQLIGLGAAKENAGSSGMVDDMGEGTVDVFGWESWTEKIHKWVWCGSDRNVRGVWVNGRFVHGLNAL